MRLQTLSFAGDSGWSAEPSGELDSDRTVIFAFGASGFVDDPRPLAALRSLYPRSKIVGCSTSGEIFGTKIADGTMAVAVAALEHGEVASASTRVETTQGSFAAGADLARQLARPDLRGVVVLSDGLNVNGSELVRGLNSVLPSSVVVTGGLAGDGDRFRRTWVVDAGRPADRCVSAVGLYGDRLRIGHGSQGGWDIFGPERVVTRSQGNVLYELDGRPALDLYKEYLGERASGLPATALLFPLAVREVGSDKSVVRTILAVDEANRSMTFAGDIGQGSRAQLMRANFDRLVQGASDAAVLARDSSEPGAGAVLSLAISCVGRRLVLGERSEEEVEATMEVLPKGTAQVGFYSYGEISPHASGRCDLHNQTMTLTTISEA